MGCGTRISAHYNLIAIDSICAFAAFTMFSNILFVLVGGAVLAFALFSGFDRFKGFFFVECRLVVVVTTKAGFLNISTSIIQI